MSEKSRNTTFDILKALSCFAVVFIHYSLSGDYANIGKGLSAFCRFAVPVFFGISGFYLTSSKTISDASVLRKIRHILKLLLISGIFYLVYQYCYNAIAAPVSNYVEYRKTHVTGNSLLAFFFVNDPLFYDHLWFLLALLYCYLTVLFLFKQGKYTNFICCLMPLLLFGMTISQEFYSWLPVLGGIRIPGTEATLYYGHFFAFRAMPFFLFGVICRKFQQRIAKIPGTAPFWWLLALAGCGIAIAERFWTAKVCQFYLGSYLTTAALFVCAIKYPQQNNRLLSYIGRELSLHVYILHIAVGKLFDFAAGKYKFRSSTALYIFSRPLIILMLTLLVAFIVSYTNRHYVRRVIAYFRSHAKLSHTRTT